MVYRMLGSSVIWVAASLMIIRGSFSSGIFRLFWPRLL